MTAAAETSELAEQTAFIADKNSDLILRIGSTVTTDPQRVFQVCSKTLCRVSRVFEEALFGPWADSNDNKGQWIVELPEDEPRPFEVLLPMMNGLLWLVKVPSTDLMCQIVKVAEKYDLFDLILPFREQWSQIPINDSNPEIATCLIFRWPTLPGTWATRPNSPASCIILPSTVL
ncbi:hypothetical protein QBC38DRAFT_446542 [Podospora fimiseda]|uniref:BTB domain-containing protein n=1 Tax=Podospora fimiseda TaxID=252190 RepID=A0AAN7BJD2_9PEZI|nr:hypothetical protein QBC38DRAFT_446542 [Podospora fimiseda]